jgi:hypothetical protein
MSGFALRFRGILECGTKININNNMLENFELLIQETQSQVVFGTNPSVSSHTNGNQVVARNTAVEEFNYVVSGIDESTGVVALWRGEYASLNCQ